MPEPIVAKHHQFAICHQSLHWLLFQHEIFTVVEIIEQSLFANEKATRNVPLRYLRFLIESNHSLVAYIELAKSPRRADAGHRHGFAMSSVKINQGSDIDVADSVTIGQHKPL